MTAFEELFANYDIYLRLDSEEFIVGCKTKDRKFNKVGYRKIHF